MGYKIKQTFGFFILVFLISSFQLIKTQLRITVLDDLGNIHAGASVTLFESKENFDKDKPYMGPNKTNQKGQAIFMNIGKGPFVLEVEHGEYNNDFGGQWTDTLEEGKINKVNVVISK